MNFCNLSNETSSSEDSIIEIDLASIILEVILSVLSISLNLLNIALILISTKKQRTYSNIIFLLNSIADFIICFINIPGDVYITYTDGSWTFSIVACVIYKTFDYANSNFSLMLLLLITIRRLLQLKDPFKQKVEMNRWRWLLIFILLVLNYVIWFAIWFVYFNKEENKGVCYLKTFEVYFYAFNSASTIITFILIRLMNASIIREFIIRKSKKMARRNKKEDNAIYCILAITANLIICWGLFIIIWPIKKICKYCVPEVVYTLSYLLNHTFAATNPIIILVFNQNYRSILFRKLNINELENRSNQNTSRMKSVKTENTRSSKL